MDITQLEKGKELTEIIKTTTKALAQLKDLQKFENLDSRHYNDNGSYNLHIGLYTDGSGINAELCRYFGNKELINVIIETVEKQLLEFEEMFKNL
jgi:hypothetical protein